VVGDNAPMSGTPLSPEDVALLQLEGGPLVGHTCKVICFEADAPSPAELRERIAERVPDVPALSLRLSDADGHMTWMRDPDFDPRAHVVEGRPPRPLEREELRQEVARLFAEHLDRARPLWRIDVLPLARHGAALVWRLHHALADGTTAMRYASALLWDEQPVAPARSTAGDLQARDEQRRRAHLARFFAREFGRAGSPFDGRVGSRREVAFARLPLERLHAATKELAGATVNDAVISAVGGGLSAWMEHHHGQFERVRVKIPVSLHRQGDQAANADSFFFVAVPLGRGDPVGRLRAVHTATTERKAEHEAETMDELLRALRGVSPRLAGFCERMERSARAFALNVSNVPGPRGPVSVLGSPVASLHSLAEIAEHHAVRVAAVSMDDGLFLGFCADPNIVPDVGEIAEASEREASDLIAAARATRE
jgi:diacylglycerol O-acyltransferase / wax synthase